MARLIPVLVLLTAWEALARLIGNRLFPPASTVMAALAREAASGQLAVNLGATLVRVASAFTVAMVLGTVLGMTMGRFRRVDRALDSLV
ncbi:MAG: ABC transporter permease, partial [Gemmatimonadaceae bacterium]|nr:ABC transporter permease [Acetobacteraceae bacterium]